MLAIGEADIYNEEKGGNSMKKTIGAVSLGCIVIYGLSLILLILAIFSQGTLVPALYGLENQAFVFPVAPVFTGVFMLAISILAFYFGLKDGMSAWLNILLLALPVVAMTPLSGLISGWQSVLCGRYFGQMLSSLSTVTQLCSLATILNPLAYAAYMVSGGMRIVYHHEIRKAAKQNASRKS